MQPVAERIQGEVPIDGRYLLRESRAHGEICQHMAFDLALQREVVLWAADSERSVPLLRSTAQTLARLEHDVLPLCHDYGEGGLYPAWMVVGEAVGRSFSEGLRAGQFDLMRALPVLQRVAEALVHAHRRGLTHGKIDADEVLVTAAGSVYVRNLPNGAVASLETVRNDRIALGALLDLVLRELPSRSSERRARAEVAAIRDAALADEGPYADVADLVADLDALHAGRVVRAHAVGPLAELRKWVSRHRAFASVVVLCLVTCTAAAAGVALVKIASNRRLAAAATDLRLAALEAEASESLAELTRRAASGLGDAVVLDRLLEGAERLWPAVTQDPELYDDWLVQAGRLCARAVERRELLETLLAPSARASLAEIVSPDDQAWLQSMLSELDQRVTGFAEPEVGEMARVRRARTEARELIIRSCEDDSARAGWAALLADLVEERRSGAPSPNLVAPIVGLIPLGRDPASGFHEFAHLATGTPPTRDVATGALALAPESGVVLVLLPGGTFWMGAQSDDPAALNFSADASVDEGPVHAVSLAPFLCSKFEVTAGQWSRLTGKEPMPGEGPLHPAHQLTWEMAARGLARGALLLPTEAQWEYAARGGTEALWWTGDDPASVRDAGNVRDRSHNPPDSEPWTDGFPWHSPVGSFRPNPFGLFDTIGNVAEHCRDRYSPYALPVRGPDAERLIGTATHIVTRGGHIYVRARQCSSSARSAAPRDYLHIAFGMRPVMRIR